MIHRALLAGLLVSVGTHTRGETEVTFARQIAPLLNRHCIACHRPEGSAPFSLLGYEAARRRSRLMAEVTADRYMPPWKPETGFGPPLQQARRLTDADVSLLRAWADGGAPAGDLNLAPPAPPPPTEGWTLGPPDLVLQADDVYHLAAAGSDVFRNFVLPLPLTQRRFVRAVEFLPDTRNAIHHAVLALDPTSGSRARDAADAGPGFDSMDLGQAINPNGHIIGWTPGQVPYEVLPGTAWELKPGTDLIVQLHLVPTGKPEAIRPRIGLYFTDQPPALTSTVIQLREYDLDIPAGAADHAVEETFTLPIATRVLGVYPHAHYLGKDLQVFAELPSGRRQGLIRIPDWDFNWQSDYRYVDPLPLPAGTRIVMRYTYDNSAANPRNPARPPQRVRAGWRSSDEMGEVALQLLLHDSADRVRLDEAQARYDLASGAASPAAWYNLALALDYQDRPAEAETAYARALALDPTLSKAANNLGALAERRGDLSAALTHYQAARRADPHGIEPRLNLARLLARRGASAEAHQLLQDALQDQPRHLRVRLALADLLVVRRDSAAARLLLAAAPAELSADARVLLRQGKLSALAGDTASARTAFSQAASAGILDEDTADQLSRETRAEARYNLAILAQESGSLSAVTAELEAALKAWPAHPESLLMSLAVAGVRRDQGEQGRLLDRLLNLPATRRFDAVTLRSFLPGPDGALLLADALVRSGDLTGARRLIADTLAAANPGTDPQSLAALKAWFSRHNR